ncbi:hypothetical protein B0T09DRAFT_261456, partial [Sordaria sp. MPI-SDFR-AT-0083]
ILPTPIHKLPLTGLSMGERTGSRDFQWVWSYVIVNRQFAAYITHTNKLIKESGLK